MIILNITTLPVLILRNNILFPHDEIRLELDNEQNKELISLACSYYDKYILIVFFALSFIAVVFHFFLANFINFIILFSMFVCLYILFSNNLKNLINDIY